MLNAIFAFLPMAVSLIGLVAFLQKKGKGYAQLVFTFLLMVVSLYYLADGFYMIRYVNYKTLVCADVLSAFVTAALPVVVLVYIRFAFRSMIDLSRFVIYLIPAAVCGCGTLSILCVMGLDEMAGMYASIDSNTFDQLHHPLFRLARFWTSNVYMGLLVLELLILVIFMIYWGCSHHISLKEFYGFLFKNKPYPVKNIMFYLFVALLIVCIIRVAFGRRYLLWNPIESALLSFATALIIAVCIGFAYLPRRDDLRLSEIFAGKVKITPQPEKLFPAKMTVQDVMNSKLNRLSLMSDSERIAILLLNDKYYLEKEASLADASRRIGVSKLRINTVSMTQCSCTFEELLDYCRKNYPAELA